MATILITGANGQLGNDLRIASSEFPEFDFIFTDVAELNICSQGDVGGFLKEHAVSYIINCAAYTAVDKAEDEKEMAGRINHDAVRYLAMAAKEHQIKIIHISTDYVFDGTNYRPYVETDPVAPVSVYGMTKLKGEEALNEIYPQNSMVIRTSWLYSTFGNNFVKTMIRLGKERDRLNVVFDQVGTPTYSGDLALAILQIIDFSEKQGFRSGVYHYSNEGVCSWYDFTKSIHKMAGISCQVSPIEGKEYPAKASRPYYSVLNKRKIKETFSLTIPHWEESLKKCVNILIG
ncbi:MAG: dTDP-4-dehydrorhamnose reductase [Candidatus Azobacteroides sp.]|nr:dTDP-4-dehydrorhamnose reductase [Candidatus Azobacteroides sp.]